VNQLRRRVDRDGEVDWHHRLPAAFLALWTGALVACGGSGSGSDTTTNPTAPTIATQPQSQTVAAGSTATFSVMASGTAPLSYQWSKNGAAISGATNSSYTTPATVSGDNGATFTVTVSNSAGSQTSNAATLTVTAAPVAPTIATQPQSQTVTVGSMATFSVVASGTAPLSYQWSKSGTAITGATSASYTTPATVSGDNGATFTVKVSNSAGSQTSNAATLTVNPASGVTVTVSPRRVGLTTSEPQTFTATVTGNANTSVTWSVDGIANGNSTVGMISSGGVYTPPATAGVHTVTATSVASPGTSATSSVAVTDLAGVTTQRYDAARTGQNLSEYALTGTTVGTAGAFGKLFSCTISDGPVYAQPLYVANLAISGGTHNVLFVATQQNTVYAFDADASSCTTYWKVNLDPSGSVPVPNGGSQGDGDLNGPYGIFGTPVIDLAGGVLYAVAATLDNGSTFNYRLHELNLATGADKVTPAVIGATVSGVIFDPSVHMQRPALLLVGNTVFVSFGSYGDANTYYGWVMGYSKTTLSQVAAFNTAPHSTESTGAAVWMAGAGPAADSSGDIYFSTANGPFNASNTLPPVSPKDSFGDTLLKLTSSSLTIADFFTPADQGNLDSSDLDLGSGGVVVLPDGAGSVAHPNLAIAADKESNLYVVDRGNMAKYQTGGSGKNGNVATVQVNTSGNGITSGIFSTATYWNGNVYIGAIGDHVKAYSLANILATAYPGPAPGSQSSESYGYPGSNIAVSAAGAGATSAVAWALDTNASGTGTGGAGGTGPAILRAYDATNLRTTLWSSSTNSADKCGNAVKFAVPTVANGKVYVAGTNQLTVYGLLP